MKYQFRTDIETKVPTCALIENYQDLSRAIKDNDWDLVQVVADCLADTINDYTTVPEGLDIKPSGSSLILMSEESGIIVDEDGEDIRCSNGVPVSDALSNDCSQCACCPEEVRCRPEIGRVRLREGEGGVFDTKNPAMALVLLSGLKKEGESMNKDNKLKELRFLVSHLEPSNISDLDLNQMLKLVRDVVRRDVNPVFRIGNFVCWLDGYALKDFFRVKISIVDPAHPFLSQKEIGEIMNHYGVHGEARYYIMYGINKVPTTISLSVATDEEMNPIMKPYPLTLRQARILDSRAKGVSYAEIAIAEVCSVDKVIDTLIEVSIKSNQYGFRQIWPVGIEMSFSEDEYAKAVKVLDLPELAGRGRDE